MENLAMNAIVMSPASAVKSETCQPWDRIEGETQKAFAAFVVYRNIGSDRAIQKQQTCYKKVGLFCAAGR